MRTCHSERAAQASECDAENILEVGLDECLDVALYALRGSGTGESVAGVKRLDRQ